MEGGSYGWSEGLAEICIITQTMAMFNAATRQQSAQQNPKVFDININKKKKTLKKSITRKHLK